ncbi:glycosyltransferase family A protein [Cronbergia sp. UHCC 0137]|uniref:glycosyltransferase family 2 protein n=1 Tax=Cronbergia sp. UHCC 0137 TaxID=3110239 RepID=UPI002B200423|nr:glycosyltransferase family A protein [Cronbergia sp. UHCC 0137]MEA5619903.1 glycosyltransferase family A protein [Cronbergia sp. UHCC 0137]
MEDNPLVTVIIPVYNYANYIAATLDSVFAQTYCPIEVIVVDDGSTDNSADIVRSYPEVQYFYQSNQGAAVARNMAIAQSTGEYIAFLDADDYWKPNKLKVQMKYMMDNPEIRITATNVFSFLEPDTQVPTWFKSERELGETNGMVLSSIVVHKAVFREIGDFSPPFFPSEDTEWFCRVKDAQISLVILPIPLTLRRLHGSNLTWQMITTASSRTLRIFRESLIRKSRSN